MLSGGGKAKPLSACIAPTLGGHATGDCVRTVGFAAAGIRPYSRNQAEQEKRAAQLALGDGAPRREGQPTHGAGPGSPSAPGGGLLQRCPLRGPPATAPPVGAYHNSAPLQGGILKPPALRVVVDFMLPRSR